MQKHTHSVLLCWPIRVRTVVRQAWVGPFGKFSEFKTTRRARDYLEPVEIRYKSPYQLLALTPKTADISRMLADSDSNILTPSPTRVSREIHEK